MKCLIAVNPFARTLSVKEKALRIKEALNNHHVESDILSVCEMPVSIENSVMKAQGAENYRFCIYLDKDKYFAKALEKYMPVFNCSQATEWCDDKFVTFMRLAGSDIPMPMTIPAPLSYSGYDEEKIKGFLDYVEKELGYPLIVKESYGSLGKQVYLIKNREELNSTYARLYHTTHLYQKYVGKNINKAKDYRIITIGGKFVTAMERDNENDFRSNIAAGGHGTKAENLPQSYIDCAEKVSKILKLDYAGIDLMPGENERPWFIEANSNAFFKEVEKVTGVDLADLFVSHCLGKL